MTVHVRKKRRHHNGALEVHLHQFGRDTLWGFDVYHGPPADEDALKRSISHGVYPSMEAAMNAADAAVHGGQVCGCDTEWEDHK